MISSPSQLHVVTYYNCIFKVIVLNLITVYQNTKLKASDPPSRTGEILVEAFLHNSYKVTKICPKNVYFTREWLVFQAPNDNSAELVVCSQLKLGPFSFCCQAKLGRIIRSYWTKLYTLLESKLYAHMSFKYILVHWQVIHIKLAAVTQRNHNISHGLG